MPEDVSTILRGVIPVAPTIFREDEQLDLPGLKRVIDYLADGGSDGVCILANYSEQFSLTDAERSGVIDASVSRTQGRLPLVVTTSHYSAFVARQRSLDAVSRGADMIMMMAPFFGANLTVSDHDVLEYFKRVCDGIEVDVMIQDAPMSPTPLSVELIAKIAQQIPQVRYVKIEMPRTARKLRDLRASAPELMGLFDGEESVTLIPDLHAGAQGTMCSAVAPDMLGEIVRDFHRGQVAQAAEAWEDLLPLLHYENRQCGLSAAKFLLAAGGIVDSARTRAPYAELDLETGKQLLELAKQRDLLILNWR